MLLVVGGGFSVAPQFLNVPLGGGFEMLAIGRNLAKYGAFANPYSEWATGPTAMCPPIFPGLLGVIGQVVGTGDAFNFVVATLGMMIHGLHAVLLPSVSELFFGDRKPGIWAAISSILFPVFFFFPQFDIMYTAVGLMLFCLAAARLVTAGGTRQAILCGTFAGGLLLLNPASGCLTAPWLLYQLWRTPATPKLRFLGSSILAAVVTLTPWSIRNYRQFHEIIPVRDNLGLELRVGNNDIAGPSFATNLKSQMLYHPNITKGIAMEVQAAGEPQYFRDQGRAAVTWIEQNPGRFLSLAAARFRIFWISEPLDTTGHRAAILWTTVASIAGLALIVRRRLPIAVFVGAIWLVYPLLYYCVQSDPRYRVPIMWLSLLAAGYFASAVWSRGRESIGRRPRT